MCTPLKAKPSNHHPVSLLLVCSVFYFSVPGVKQNFLKVKRKGFAPLVGTFPHTIDVSVFLTLPFQPDVEPQARSLNVMEVFY